LDIPLGAFGHPKNPSVFGERGEWFDKGVSLRGGCIFEMLRTPTRFEVLSVQFSALVWTSFSVALSALTLCVASANWFQLFASLPFCVREKVV
jgi:hypothetical protein